MTRRIGATPIGASRGVPDQGVLEGAPKLTPVRTLRAGNRLQTVPAVPLHPIDYKHRTWRRPRGRWWVPLAKAGGGVLLVCYALGVLTWIYQLAF